MLLPNRHESSNEYRYAFNGMETDKEVTGSAGGSYTTQFRQYDPRLGRWKSIDPKAGKFPWMSPFTGMDNNPISLTDVLGLESGNNVDKVKDVKRGKGRRRNARKNRKKAKKIAKKEGIDEYKITYNPDTGNATMSHEDKSADPAPKGVINPIKNNTVFRSLGDKKVDKAKSTTNGRDNYDNLMTDLADVLGQVADELAPIVDLAIKDFTNTAKKVDDFMKTAFPDWLYSDLQGDTKYSSHKEHLKNGGGLNYISNGNGEGAAVSSPNAEQTEGNYFPGSILGKLGTKAGMRYANGGNAMSVNLKLNTSDNKTQKPVMKTPDVHIRYIEHRNSSSIDTLRNEDWKGDTTRARIVDFSK